MGRVGIPTSDGGRVAIGAQLSLSSPVRTPAGTGAASYLARNQAATTSYDLCLFCSRPTALWDGYVELTTCALRRVKTPIRQRPVIERASPADLAFLAMDTGAVPQQFAVTLILKRPGDFGLDELRQLIVERILALPRLRQRLIKVPPGCGRSVWVDDLDFAIDRHVRAVLCRSPGDEAALLETALSVIMTPLSKDHPLWSIILITGLAEGAVAVVVVLHHVLADGLGGLNVLAALLDPGASPAALPFPRPLPSRASLARDAWTARLAGIRRIPASWRSLQRGMFAGGGLAAAAHRSGATTNDAVLVAVAAALHQILRSRGEYVDPIVVTVPVSSRAGGGREVGNLVSPMLVDVPTTGSVAERLAEVEAAVRANKAAATGPPPIAVLGGLFRLLARLGGYRFYMNHQRRFHTLVTHVRGPAERVRLSGHEVSTAIPVAVAEGGNMSVYFEVLSYAAGLTITAIVDADHGPDPDEVIRRLRNELDLIMALLAPEDAI
jgi:diacylglycerol O-acyltransferase